MDDDDDDDGSGMSIHQGSVEPQMMPPQFQNQPPYPIISDIQRSVRFTTDREWHMFTRSRDNIRPQPGSRPSSRT